MRWQGVWQDGFTLIASLLLRLALARSALLESSDSKPKRFIGHSDRESKWCVLNEECELDVTLGNGPVLSFEGLAFAKPAGSPSVAVSRVMSLYDQRCSPHPTW